jgi:hypothetical protein
MANVKTLLAEWSVRDLEDNSTLSVRADHCTELGNQGVPGIQVFYMGHYVNFEPLIVERWAYQAQKAGVSEYLLADYSWIVHQDQYVKVFLIIGSPLKARVEIKSRTSKPVTKEFDLPFEV